MAQQVRDLALSLLWHRFSSWPANFHMPWVQTKRKGEKKKKKKEASFLLQKAFLDFLHQQLLEPGPAARMSACTGAQAPCSEEGPYAC